VASRHCTLGGCTMPLQASVEAHLQQQMLMLKLTTTNSLSEAARALEAMP